MKSALHSISYLLICYLLYDLTENLLDGKLGSWKMLVCEKNLSKEWPWNVKLFLPEWRKVGSLSNMDFLKLQMRYVDGLKVAVNSTKKLSGGMKLDNAVKVKRKTWKQWKGGGSKEGYLKVIRAAKTAAYFPMKDAQAE